VHYELLSSVSDALFNKVQMMLEKNKMAPARAKAKAEYLLTTKLYCGLCGSLMAGISCHNRKKVVYNYYSCNMSRKKEKRSVSNWKSWSRRKNSNIRC
jgi:site-specific DNA recombinase